MAIENPNTTVKTELRQPTPTGFMIARAYTDLDMFADEFYGSSSRYGASTVAKLIVTAYEEANQATAMNMDQLLLRKTTDINTQVLWQEQLAQKAQNPKFFPLITSILLHWENQGVPEKGRALGIQSALQELLEDDSDQDLAQILNELRVQRKISHLDPQYLPSIKQVRRAIQTVASWQADGEEFSSLINSSKNAYEEQKVQEAKRNTFMAIVNPLTLMFPIHGKDETEKNQALQNNFMSFFRAFQNSQSEENHHPANPSLYDFISYLDQHPLTIGTVIHVVSQWDTFIDYLKNQHPQDAHVQTLSQWPFGDNETSLLLGSALHQHASNQFSLARDLLSANQGGTELPPVYLSEARTCWEAAVSCMQIVTDQKKAS